MLRPHSLELALQEADGFHVEPLLRRANVSPFFTSSRAPQQLEPRGGGGGGSGVDPTPLSLDLCGLCGNDNPQAESLSRVSSWCDFSLDGDASVAHARDPTASHDAAAGSTANAWQLFLEGKTLTGGVITYAIKSPTAHALPAFPGFFSDEPTGPASDPTAFSPTHMDKKVLVTDSDLKLDAAAAPPSRHHTASTRARCTKREELSPQDGHAAVWPPRHALLSEPLLPLPHSVASRPPYAMPDADADADADAAPSKQHLPMFCYPPSLAATLSANVVPLADQYWKPTRHADEVLPAAAARGPPIETFLPHEYAASFRRVGRSYLAAMAGAIGATTHPHAPVAPTTRKPSKRKIGIYSPEARRERIRRFHEKRKLRVFHKRIKYDCRKRLANSCPRFKGRFMRKLDVGLPQQQEPQEPTASTTWSSLSSTTGSECGEEQTSSPRPMVATWETPTPVA